MCYAADLSMTLKGSAYAAFAAQAMATDSCGIPKMYAPAPKLTRRLQNQFRPLDTLVLLHDHRSNRRDT
jgi:hypothetical protein